MVLLCYLLKRHDQFSKTIKFHDPRLGEPSPFAVFVYLPKNKFAEESEVHLGFTFDSNSQEYRDRGIGSFLT